MSYAQRTRLRQRLIRHHLPLFTFSAAAIAALYVTRPYRDVLSKASFATAYPALLLLVVTLLLGPWRLFRKKRNPVSDDLRRDVGTWAAALGILHSIVGQCVHMRGKPWTYYVYGAGPHHVFPLRHDLFGLANYTGAIGTLVLLALLATSNDYSLRVMGTPQWKKLQRWNYAVFVFVAIHAAAYQGIEKQKLPFVTLLAISIIITIALQLMGFLKRKATSEATAKYNLFS